MNRYRIYDKDGVVTIDAPTFAVAIALYVRDHEAEDFITKIERIF